MFAFLILVFILESIHIMLMYSLHFLVKGVVCPSLNVQHSNALGMTAIYEDRVVVRCVDGYLTAGAEQKTASLVCNDVASYDPPPPTCIGMLSKSHYLTNTL